MKSFVITFVALVFVVSIISLMYLHVPQRMSETFANESCEITDNELNKIYNLIQTIRNTFDNLEDFPFKDPAAFKITRTIMLTRLQYLLAVFGNKLSKYQIAHMLQDKQIEHTFKRFALENTGLLQEAQEAYNEIVSILEKHVHKDCPVCDPFYIYQAIQRVDNEFAMYFQYLFKEKLENVEESTKKVLMNIELDIMMITVLVEQAMNDQHINKGGTLDFQQIDDVLERLEANYLMLAADINLYKILHVDVDGIMAFINMKKIIINDMKRCIVIPMVFSSCNFGGNSAILREGEYPKDVLRSEYQISDVSSFKVPSNYNVFLHFSNGDIRIYNSDQPCLTDTVRSAFTKIVVSLKTF